MSKSDSGDELWAEMTDAQKLETVRHGEATLKQLAAGLLDGSEDLRVACRQCLAHTDDSLAGLYVPAESPADDKPTSDSCAHSPAPPSRASRTARESKSRRKFGLPAGFVPRLQRFGKTVLLENNIYRLPDLREYIPCQPRGTLGHGRHRYALLSTEQYSHNLNGSVYVRADGRIFDYSLDSGVDPEREPFDTGYTIYDLERTGRYGPVPDMSEKQKEKAARKSAVTS